MPKGNQRTRHVSHQARQPFREMEGVYLVSPTAESVEAIKRDFSSPADALYAKVHLFFLERVPPDLLQSIKQCRTLVSRLKTFKVSEKGLSLACTPYTMNLVDEDLRCTFADSSLENDFL